MDHGVTRFLGPIRTHNPNGILIGSAIFAQMTVGCPYTLQWDAPFLQKLPLPMGGSGPPCNTWFPGPLESSTQMVSRSVQQFLQGSLVWHTDRPTDRPTHRPRYSKSVTIGCINVSSKAILPKNPYMYTLLPYCRLSTTVGSRHFNHWSKHMNHTVNLLDT